MGTTQEITGLDGIGVCNESFWRKSSPWSVPDGCPPWPPRPAVVEVKDALLTPHRRDPQGKANGRPLRLLRGAVHDAEGWLVPQSQRVAGRNDRNVPADPPRVDPPADLERLNGNWYYLGHWMWQFGHFVIETLPSLWAHRKDEPLIAHRFGDDGNPSGWQLQFLRLAGLQPPTVISDRAVRVDNLRVPTRPAVVGAAVSSEAVEVWQRLARKATGGEDLPRGRGSMIAYSRSRLEANRRGGLKARRMVTNADALDAIWRRNGFEVVYPETLSIVDQIRLVRRARVLIGLDGSALHTSAFARPGTSVIMVGTMPRPEGNLSQRAIDGAMANHLAVLPWRGGGEGRQHMDLVAHEEELKTALSTMPD